MTSPKRMTTLEALVTLFVFTVVSIVFVVFLVTHTMEEPEHEANGQQDAVAARIAPVGQIQVAEAPSAASAGGAGDGEGTFKKICSGCHGAGLLGSPKFGDKAAWAPRIAQGLDTLYNSALKGKNAMPAKGGNPALADADVKAAVQYMVNAAK
jgi:cytochrome c5